ncbi:MAG: MarR family transcriptional regulator [Thermotogae bacterium]|nr:MarR family transcriptional regulator [Thermotogota bacterium]
MNERETKVEKILDGLFREIPHLMKNFHRSMDKILGLNKSQIMVFSLLHRGKKGLKEISEQSHISKGMLSVAVQSLVEKGYVQRVEDKNDRRRNILTVTSRGEKLIGEIEEKIKRYVKDNLYILSDEELDTLIRAIEIFKKISKNITNKQGRR